MTASGETTAAPVESSGDQVSKIALESSLDISVAAKLQTEFRECAERRADVELDAEKVTTIDTAGLQLLLVLVEQIQRDGNRVTWLSSSDALTSVAKLTGMQAKLGLT